MLLVALLASLMVLLSLAGGISDCEKSASVALTPSQKKELCDGFVGPGPGLCSVAAKRLHYHAKEIISICQGAVSAAPAECLGSLSPRDRKHFGKDLCPRGVRSTMSAECFNTLSASPFKGGHAIKEKEAVDFCTQLEDDGPIACMLAIVESGISPQVLPARHGLVNGDGVESCLDSSLYYAPNMIGGKGELVRDILTGKPYKSAEKRSIVKELLHSMVFWKRQGDNHGILAGSTTGKQLAITACLEELKHTMSHAAGKGLQLDPRGVLRFCMHANPFTLAPQSARENFFSDGHRLEKLQSNRKTGVPEYFRSYAAECVVRAGEINENLKDDRPKFFNTTHRFQLCEGVDNRNGPVNCAKLAIYKLSEGRSDKFTPEVAVTLCNGAGGIDSESAKVVRYESRKEEWRRIRARSRNRKVREEAESQYEKHVAETLHRIGLGPAMCYVEGERYVRDVETRAALCMGAEGAGPAHCFGRSKSIPGVLDRDRLILCVGAGGDDPAICMQAAPTYLEVDEKLQLCTGAGRDSRESDQAVQCLRRVEGPSKLLRNAPKKTVGAMLGMLRGDEASLRGRELLIHMCSSSVTDNPLAAAACLKSAPLQLEHDDVIRACTNATSAEVLSRVALCSKLLPPDWSYTQAMKLCAWEPPIPEGDAANNTTAERIRRQQDRRQETSSTHTTVQCALEVSRTQVYGEDGKLVYWGKEEVSEMCKSETDQGSVRKCALAVKPTSAAPTSHNANFLTASAVTAACKAAKDDTPGVCLSKLNKMAYQYKVGFAENEGVPEEICTCDDPAYALSCLEGTMRKQKTISLSDLDSCFSQPRRIEGARVQYIRSSDGAPFPTAGAHFSITFDLVDQFGSTFEPFMISGGDGGDIEVGGHDCGTANVDNVPYQVAINEGNEQGAVLWGIRQNKTACGVLHFSNLVVSQPGEVQVKVVSRESAHANANIAFSTTPVGSAATTTSAILTTFVLHVHPDPNQGSVATGLCLFPFKEGMTGATELPLSISKQKSGTELSSGKIAFDEAGPAVIRSYLPVQRYLRLLHCAATFDTWHVSLHKGQAGFWVEFRNGIDAIWTGKGLPRYEDTFEERLGLPAGLLEESMRLPTVWPEMPLEAALRRNATKVDNEEGKDLSSSITVDKDEEGAQTKDPDNEDGELAEGERAQREETAEEIEEREKLEAAEDYARLLQIWEREVAKRKERECNTTQALLEQAGNATMTDEEYRNCTLGIPLNETTEQYDKRITNIENWMFRYKAAKQREVAREAAVAEHERKITEELNMRKERHTMKKRALIKIERATQKMLRRAYYAKSLRWHPDRWVGFSYYAEQVRHTFESVTDAYDNLQALITLLSEANAQAVIEGEKIIERGHTEEEKGEEKGGEADEPIVPAPTPESSPHLFA